MNKGTTIFIDTEDMEERYGEELYKEYLEKENKQLKQENQQLQNKWNELKNYLILCSNFGTKKETYQYEHILDKMSELERVNDEHTSN